jgi:hypothetical protein
MANKLHHATASIICPTLLRHILGASGEVAGVNEEHSPRVKLNRALGELLLL